jgi:hypothetical protein
MIIKQETANEAQVIGDIENNKVGIDRANIDFIATLLTSNLYSNPFESFLRETISNAYDAQVEAGNQDKNIILLIQDHKENSNELRISIRDYGTGISPERFDTIYNKIGSSTKRESNDYIGGLGIGKFAGLSLSDVVEINSYYNGTLYSYLMYKNGTGIQIDKISEEPTEGENGVEVSVVIPYNRYSYSENNKKAQAIYNMCYFENLVAICTSEKFQYFSAKDFNERTIVVKDNYSFCELQSDCIALKVGKVLYPTQTYNMDTPISKVAINIPIGSVTVTPNRESLIYTDETSKFVNNKYEAAVNDLCKDIANAYKKELTNLYELQKFFIDQVLYYNPCTGEISNKQVSRKYYERVVDNLGLKDEAIKFLRGGWMNDFAIPMLYVMRYIKLGDIWSMPKGSYAIPCFFTKWHTTFNRILILDTDKISIRTKAWANDHYNLTNTVVMHIDDARAYLKAATKTLIRKYGYSASIIRAYIKDFIKYNKNLYILKESDIPEDFKVTRSVSIAKTIKTNENDITVDEYAGNSYTRTNLRLFKRNRAKDTIIYATRSKDMPELFLAHSKIFYPSSEHHLVFCAISKDTINIVQDWKNWISFEEFIKTPNKYISRVMAATVIRAQQLPTYAEAILSDEVRRKLVLRRTFLSNNSEVLPTALKEYYTERKWIDTEAIAYYWLSDAILEYMKATGKVANEGHKLLQAIAIDSLPKETLVKLPAYLMLKKTSNETLKTIVK